MKIAQVRVVAEWPAVALQPVPPVARRGDRHARRRNEPASDCVVPPRVLRGPVV